MKLRSVLSTLAVLASCVCQSQAACYYTEQLVCRSAGEQLSSVPVTCRSGSGQATLYDQDILEGNAITFRASPVGESSPKGYTGKFDVKVQNTVWVKTVRVNSSNCDVTVTSHAYQTTITCTGSMADAFSTSCSFTAKRTPIRSLYTVI
jgi:hypothetical protein